MLCPVSFHKNLAAEPPEYLCRGLHLGRVGRLHLWHAVLAPQAAVLAARACLRSGPGLVTAHCPGSGNVILQSSVPEAMLSLDASDSIFSEVPDLSAYSAVAIGPGIGNVVLALTAGGLASFVFGSYLLFNTGEMPVPWPAIITSALATALFFGFAVSMALAAQRRPPGSGMTGLVGTVATWDHALTEAEVAGMGGWIGGASTPTPLMIPEPSAISLLVLGGLLGLIPFGFVVA